MDKLKVWDKTFRPYIKYEEISKDIDAIAERLNQDYSLSDDIPVILTVLNGSIMFTGEILKRVTFPCVLGCIKVKSYEGTTSTGKINVVCPLTCDVKGKKVIIIEDIVDTGHTLKFLREYLEEQGASEIKTCTLFFKKESFKYDGQVPVEYVAREIENKFILGFGLDYDELGRNTKDVYILDI